jgi:hypothetical protein
MWGELRCSVNKVDVAAGNVRMFFEVDLGSAIGIAKDAPRGLSEEG